MFPVPPPKVSVQGIETTTVLVRSSSLSRVMGKSCPCKDVEQKIAEHRAAIQSYPSYFGGHFSLQGHSVNEMVLLAIEKVRCSDPKLEPALRKRREKQWINRYNATTYGCNKRE